MSLSTFLRERTHLNRIKLKANKRLLLTAGAPCKIQSWLLVSSSVVKRRSVLEFPAAREPQRYPDHSILQQTAILASPSRSEMVTKIMRQKNDTKNAQATADKLLLQAHQARNEARYAEARRDLLKAMNLCQKAGAQFTLARTLTISAVMKSITILN